MREAVARGRHEVAHVHNFFPLLSPSVHATLRELGVPVVQTLHNYRLVCANGIFLREGRPCEECAVRGPWRAVRYGCWRGSRLATAVWAETTAAQRRWGSWLACVDRFVAPSAFAKRKLAAAGLPAERIAVKPNPVPDPGDRQAGLLADAGRRLPMVDTVIYSLEKEDVPYWNKFLQGYYAASGISSDSFDQAIRMNADGEPDLTPDMRERGTLLATAARPSLNYMGFNMQYPVVGGDSERARLLRRALSIAIDYDEYISIFANGRGVTAQSPLAPGIFGVREGEAGIDPYVFQWRGGQVVRRPLEEARALLAKAGWPGGRNQD